MKKIVCLVLCLVMIVTMFSACGSSDDRSSVLKIYNWADYIDEEVLTEFKVYYDQKYGTDLEIVYDTFDTNEIMYTKIANGKEDYDLVCPSEYTIERMVENGLVKKMDDKIVGEVYNTSVPKMVREQFARVTGNTETNIYAVGYMWGTMGIMYNTDKVTLAELEKEGWGILWNEKYAGKIYMKDSMRESYAVGNLYVYRDEYLSLKDKLQKGELTEAAYVDAINELFNRTDAETIAKIEAALKEQKDLVDAMYDVDNDKNAMVNGSAYLDVCWSGDAAWSIVEAAEGSNGVNLDYYIPEEGTNIWFDGWVIPAYAKNEQAANEFVAYLLRGDVAVKVMDYIGYSSVACGASGDNTILEYAESMADETDSVSDVSYFFEGATEVTVNSTMYPDLAKVTSAAVMKDFGAANDAISEMWGRVKGNSLSVGAIIVIVVLAVAVVGFVVITVVKKKQSATSRAKRKKARK